MHFYKKEKYTMRKILITLCCMLVLLVAVGVIFYNKTTYKTPINESEGLEFALSSDETYYEVKGIGTCTDTDIVIPKTYNDLPVKCIGYNAFYDCQNLRSITFSNNIQMIDSNAFKNCVRLTDVLFDGTLTDWCSIEFNYTPMEYAKNFYLLSKSGKYKRLTTLNIPNGIEKINGSVFYGFRNVTSITIPETVKIIGYGAFAGCNIQKITIPSSVESIESSAFASCTNLKEIEILGNLKHFGENVFYKCSSLKLNEFDNAYYIGNNSNKYKILVQAVNKEISSCEIHKDTEIIATCALALCRNLTEISFDEESQLKVVDIAGFSHCSSLEEIMLPSSVEIIESEAFCECSNLKEIIIPKNVEKIESHTFYYCKNLTNLELEEDSKLKSIGEGVFECCVGLLSIDLRNTNSFEEIENWAFDHCNLFKLYYGGNEDQWKQIKIKCEMKNVKVILNEQ